MPSPVRQNSKATVLPETMSVLLVEPQSFLSNILRDALVNAGIGGENITEVRSAAKALEYLSAKIPDVILTELDLPDIDGDQLIKQIRSQGIINPIIAITAALTEYKVHQALEAGVSDILVKPVSQLLIAKRISRQLHIFMAPEPTQDEPNKRPNLSGYSR